MDITKNLLSAWGASKKSAVGRWIFSRVLGLFVPYSASIRPTVQAIRNGEAIITVRDRRGLRNHLNSIHAAALTNIGELASGLAMISVLPSDARGIVKNISITFLQKARGTITAHGYANLPKAITEDTAHIVTAKLFNESKELIAEVEVTWQIGPRPKANS